MDRDTFLQQIPEIVQSSDFDWLSIVPKDQEENLQFRELIARASENVLIRAFLWEVCKVSPLFWLNVFCWVFEPRPDGEHGYGRLPFITWPAQDECVNVTMQHWGTSDIVVDKARGEGASWIFLMLILHAWIFNDPDKMFTAGLASRNMDAVDNHRDPDSLMWKLDFQLKQLPKWMIGESGSDWGRFVSDHSLVNYRFGHSVMGYSADDDLGTGGRKAQPLDAKILTPTGWRPMGVLRVGDEVVGQNGRPTKVAGVFPQGEKDIFRITFSDGSQTECCDEHIWPVMPYSYRKHHRAKRFEPKKLCEIKENLILEDNRLNYQIPLVEPVEFERRSLPLPPYCLGALIGDGSLKTENATPTFANKDGEILARVASELPDGVSLVRGGRYDYRLSYQGEGKSPIKEILRNLGLSEAKSNTKFIPKDYLLSSPGERLDLLRGLLDTDGWCSKRKNSSKVCFCSVSQQLARDVVFLVQSLGGIARVTNRVPTYTHKGERRQGQKAYYVTIAMPNGMNPFFLKRKASNVSERTLYPPTRAIKSIDFVGRKQAQCIKVEAEDHLYVTDDFLVTHNTVWLWDEMSKFGTGKDKDALNSTEPTSNCRIMVSTHKGTANEYYKIVRNPGSTPLIVMDWKKNPSRNRHLFSVPGGILQGTPVLLDETEADSTWEEFLQSWPEKVEELDNKAFEWPDDKVVSPWYVERCLRAGSTPQTMAQEYDRNPEGTEQQFFSEAKIEKLRKATIRPPRTRGFLKFDYDNPLGGVRFIPDPEGQVLIWCDLITNSPLLVGEACIGCDISSGLGDSRTSNSVAVVFDRQSGEQIAEFATNRLLPDKFAAYAMALGHWFHNAQLNWETNGTNGKAFTRMVVATSYPNVYFRTVEDRLTRKKTKNIGWGSSTNTKQDILGGTEGGGLRGAIYEGSCKIRSESLLEEMKQFIYDENGRVVHAGSLDRGDNANKNEAHGDRVIAAAVSWLTVLDKPKKTPEALERQKTKRQDTMAWRLEQHDQSLIEAMQDDWNW